MTLTLTITKHPELPSGEAMSRTIDRSAVIGRGKDSDWILPDPERHLSKQHCRIEFRGDRYYVIDTSKNGVFVNDAIEPLRQGNAAELRDGDRLALGDYEFAVRLSAPPPVDSDALPARDDDPFADLPERPADLRGAPAGTPFGGSGRTLIAEADPGVDPIEALAGPEARPFGSAGHAIIPDDIDLITGEPRTPELKGAVQSDHAPAEQQHFRPPSAVREAIPENWADELVRPPVPAAASAEAPPPAAKPPRAPPSAVAGSGPGERELLGAFLAGAGVEELTLADAELDGLMRLVGQMFREMVAGLRDILMSRTAFKSEFRLERTMIRQTQNNPLKFSISADDAMQVLLRRPGPGYLAPLEAVREGVEDIKAHQVAVVAGLQVALTALLREFNPEALKQRLEQRSRLANLMPGSSKARYWELYEMFYKEVAAEAEQGFHGLFGREFRRAYEEQLKKL
jgi:type VI secretion system protein